MGSIQEEWLVYFFESKSRYSKYLWWWKHKPGFTHCGALKYIADKDVWEHIQGTHAGIRSEILDPNAASDLLAKLYHSKILVCPVKDDWHFVNLNLLSCVTFTMKLIGFYRWWIITPYQLYCALLNAGYKPFWKKRENHGQKTKNT
jgi:hypothetical protein|tara:strand:- start:1308 stop:1745 length:438 start_codon:yes stop_codon:yes gene_type:complete